MRLKKAMKKENGRKKRFLIFMIVISIFLPAVVYFYKIRSTFILSYLGVIEFLIAIAVLAKVNYHKLDFKCSNNKLEMKNSLFLKKNLLLCDKVALVHTDKYKEDMEIIIITTVGFKNTSLSPVTGGFLKRYPEAGEKYLKIKKMNPESMYYFKIVKRGGFKKYQLLDVIYRNCVKAVYTSSAIESIKLAREQNEFK